MLSGGAAIVGSAGAGVTGSAGAALSAGAGAIGATGAWFPSGPSAPAATRTRSSSRRRVRVPFPRTWGLRASDVVALLVGNGLLILAMWVRHGGFLELTSISGIITAAGQIAALYGAYLILIQLVIMSRSPWLDQLFGMDRMAWAHKWIGFSAIVLLLVHGVLTTIGYSMEVHSSVPGEFVTLLTTYPYVLWATAGMLAFAGIGISSLGPIRRRLSHDTWYGVHLYVYLAIALAFLHQFVVGLDFSTDPVARVYWILLYVVAVVSMLVFRFGQPIYLSLRHQLRVANVVREAPGVVSVYVAGRDLDQLAVRAGQYFRWRFLARNGWWRSHPFSISAAPNGEYLRLTVKEVGDWTAELQSLRPGMRVFAEGPYGAMTGARRTKDRVLLVAGGIGITPLRALLEELPAGKGAMTLIYRASRWEDVVFKDELDALMRLRGAEVHYLVGRRGTREMPNDPLDSRSLRRLVPDVHQRDVFVCGPVPMMDAVRRSLTALRVPASQVHWERFAF